MALSSIAIKYGFAELSQQALLLDLRIKILQYDIYEHAFINQTFDLSYAAGSKVKITTVQQVYKTERTSFMTYLKSLFNFFETWSSNASCKKNFFTQNDINNLETHRDKSVIFFQIWTVLNHSVFVSLMNEPTKINASGDFSGKTVSEQLYNQVSKG